MKPIGPSFSDELKAAGLLGLPFSWGTDGVIQFDSRMTQAQIDAVKAVYDAHDPMAAGPVPVPDPLDELRTALKADSTLLSKIKALK